jgi:hypothetical protein
MPRPPADALILARWTVSPDAWDAFVRAAHRHPSCRKLKLRDASDAGRTVVVGGDALHVGSERVDLTHFHVHQVVERDGWLELVELDPDALACPLPLPTDDAALAAWVRDHFRAIAGRHALEWARVSAQAAIEASRPTLSNRLLWFVERHFIACLLVFFFVVLPLGSILVARLAG